MSQTTKYEYLHVVQGQYGQGWEDLCCSEDQREARANLKEYRENCPETAHRLIERREMRQPENAETRRWVDATDEDA